jgi:hypothetical protein
MMEPLDHTRSSRHRDHRNTPSERTAQRTPSSRRLLLGLSAILLAAAAVYLFASYAYPAALADTASEQADRQPDHAPPITVIENKIISNNDAAIEELQTTFEKTHAEISSAREKLEKAKREAQKRTAPASASVPRKNVSNKLTSFRSALKRAHAKLVEMNQSSQKARREKDSPVVDTQQDDMSGVESASAK